MEIITGLAFVLAFILVCAVVLTGLNGLANSLEKEKREERRRNNDWGIARPNYTEEVRDEQPICNQCGKLINGHFCEDCGKSPIRARNICKIVTCRCGEVYTDKWGKYCGYCGISLPYYCFGK